MAPWACDSVQNIAIILVRCAPWAAQVASALDDHGNCQLNHQAVEGVGREHYYVQFIACRRWSCCIIAIVRRDVDWHADLEDGIKISRCDLRVGGNGMPRRNASITSLSFRWGIFRSIES